VAEIGKKILEKLNFTVAGFFYLSFS